MFNANIPNIHKCRIIVRETGEFVFHTKSGRIIELDDLIYYMEKILDTEIGSYEPKQ